jgi:hypothetical protein
MGFCGGQADAHQRLGAQRLQALQRQRQVAAALAPARAWISSTMTARAGQHGRPESEPSSTYSDSGWSPEVRPAAHGLALALAGVAGAHRRAHLHRRQPARRSSSRMPASGSSRLMRISLDSAFSGET